MTADTIINLAISGDISALDPASFNNVYDRHSVPKLMTILAVGEFDDDDFILSHLLIKNLAGDTVFCSSSEELLKEDPDDEDEDGSVLTTINQTLNFSEIFNDDLRYEISDFSENILSWLEPRNSLYHLKPAHLAAEGDYQIESSARGKCFISRLIGASDELDETAADMAKHIEELAAEADYDTYSEYDLTVLIKA